MLPTVSAVAMSFRRQKWTALRTEEAGTRDWAAQSECGQRVSSWYSAAKRGTDWRRPLRMRPRRTRTQPELP